MLLSPLLSDLALLLLYNTRLNIKIVNDVGMACQNVYKQGRDDIIVKVNIQSLIPASFSH